MNPKLTNNYTVFYNTYYPILCDCIQNDSDYSYTKEHCNDIKALAHKMLIGLVTGAANKDGKAIKLTCKALGIPHTYKAIKNFICTPLNVNVQQVAKD